MKHPISQISQTVIDSLIEQKKLRIVYSPDGKLFKPNYDTACMKKDFDEYPFLLQCRGDVVDSKTFDIIAKAPKKFFNINENDDVRVEDLPWDKVVSISEKLDGHMILPYVVDGKVFISSRWSFSSPTVDVAEKYMNDDIRQFVIKEHEVGRYPLFELIDSVSYIKVIYSTNEYGLHLVNLVNEDGLFVNKELGLFESYNHPSLKLRKYTTLEILAETYKEKHPFLNIVKYVNSFEHATDFEGVVVVFADGRGVKVKAEKYFKFDISPLARLDVEYIYDAKKEGTLDDKKSYLPKEILIDVERIEKQINTLTNEIQSFIMKILSEKTAHGWDRKTLVERVLSERPDLLAAVMSTVDKKVHGQLKAFRSYIIRRLKDES